MLVLNWGWIGIALACLVSGFIGGCEHKQRQLDAYIAAGEAQELATQKTIQKHEKVAQEIKSDYETRISAIRSAYRVRSPGTGLMPPSTQPSGGLDGTTTYVILAEQCTETTQQLVSLQDFIKETR
jgi:hypothetical protein